MVNMRNVLLAIKAAFAAFSICFMMYFFPGKMNKKLEEEGKIKGDGNKMTIGWQMLKGAFNILYNQSIHVGKGDEVPSTIDLVDLDSGSKINLKKMCENNVPLILNFGSCTWPPFMASLAKFASAMEKYPSFEYRIVYITEAHPIDGWSVQSPSQPIVNQQKTFEERFDTAMEFKNSISDTVRVKILVDDMDNRANITFGAIPERLAVLYNSKVQWLGGPGPFKYSVQELEKYLSKLNS